MRYKTSKSVDVDYQPLNISNIGALTQILRLFLVETVIQNFGIVRKFVIGFSILFESLIDIGFFL